MYPMVCKYIVHNPASQFSSFGYINDSMIFYRKCWKNFEVRKIKFIIPRSTNRDDFEEKKALDLKEKYYKHFLFFEKKTCIFCILSGHKFFSSFSWRSP